jgi:amino acid permease
MEKRLSSVKGGTTPVTDDAASVEAGHMVAADYVDADGHATSSPNQLHRTFTARHIQMIGLAGSIGSGLFIGTGKVSLL